jgi:hypothetical protein
VDTDPKARAALRWRLVLGQHAEEALEREGAAKDEGGQVGAAAERLDLTLGYLYDRSFSERSHLDSAPPEADLTVPAWLDGVRELFPTEAVEVLERDALTRYGLNELVTDADVLRGAARSMDLVRAILQFKHRMAPDVLVAAREVVAEVVDQLAERAERDCGPALHGPSDPLSPPIRTWKNVDWHRTIRGSLHRWDRERKQLVPERIRYHHRQRGRSRWRVVVAVDQSGSMSDSLVHASVMAAIFTRLPSVDVRLLLFDHRIVDVSELAHDPLEVLMGCQLGGGTDLAGALGHVASLVTVPERTLVVLVTDFHIFDGRQAALARAAELTEAGVNGLGLAALDTDCRASYDEATARQFVQAGWTVGALTPRQLAEHVGALLR